jgi:hemolysin activation/secretion protein
MKGFMRFRILLGLIISMTIHLEAQTFQVQYHTNYQTKRKANISETQKVKNEVELFTSIQKTLIEFYESGYLLANVDSFSLKDKTYHVYISSGSIYKWARLKQGNIDEKALSQVGFREKVYFNEPIHYKNYYRLQKRLFAYYENNGYPFAAVSIDSVSINGSQMNGVLQVNKGERILIDTIVNTGKAKIAPGYLHAYLGLKKNRPYNEAEVRKIQNRIRSLPFANMTTKPIIEFEGTKASLFLNIDKRNANQFSGIVGIVPNNDKDADFLITGDIRLRLQNLLKRGELLNVQWQRLQTATQNLKVEIMYPYLLNTPIGLEGKFNFYRIDTSFYTIQLNVAALYMLRGNDHLKLFYSYHTTRKILDENGVSTIGGINNIDVNYYGVGLQLERTDFRLNPRKGWNAYFSGAIGTKNFLSSPATDTINVSDTTTTNNQLQMQFTTHVEYYIPFAKRFTLKFAARGGYIFNNNLYANDLLRIGGLSTLRGFDEESIYSNLYGIGTTELRFLFDERSFVNVFCDAGYYQTRTRSGFQDSYVVGFGAGITFDTKIGIFTFNYALGTQQDSPVDFRRSKIHFGYINYF